MNALQTRPATKIAVNFGVLSMYLGMSMSHEKSWSELDLERDV